MKVLLKEGGNVIVDDGYGNLYKPDQLNFKTIDRKHLTTELNEAFGIIKDLIRAKFRVNVWNNLSKYYSGSARFLFDTAYTDEWILKYKPVFGDLDVMFPRKHGLLLMKALNILSNEKITNSIKVIGAKDSSKFMNSIITIFRYKDINIQIDFELVDTNDDEPTEFCRFAHSSHEKDIENGVKGVFHKLLIRSITHLIAKKGIEISESAMKILKDCKFDIDDFLEKKKNTKFTEKDIKTYSFNVNAGLREKYKPVKYKNIHLTYNKLPLYIEKEIVESDYENDIGSIFKTFGIPKSVGFSFTELFEYVKKNNDAEKFKIVFDQLIDFLYDSKDGVKMYRNDKHQSGVKKDKEHKEKLLAYIMVTYPDLKKYLPEIKEKSRKFYEKYKKDIS